MKKTKISIDSHKLAISTDILRAIAHPLRIKILKFIDTHGVINVNKIYNTLKLEQSITSQHLRVLRGAEIVKTQREGKFIRYHLDYDKLKGVVKSVNKFVDDAEL